MGINFIFAQVDDVGDQNFSIIKNNTEINLPFFSNRDSYNSNDNLNKTVIVIHGMNRNADDYFNSIYTLTSDSDLLYTSAIEKAKVNGLEFELQLITVPDVGHDNHGIEPSTCEYLFGN